jgi:hypothetical protein
LTFSGSQGVISQRIKLFTSTAMRISNLIVVIPLPGVIAVERIESLAENFEVRLNDFHIHATNVSLKTHSLLQ